MSACQLIRTLLIAADVFWADLAIIAHDENLFCPKECGEGGDGRL